MIRRMTNNRSILSLLLLAIGGCANVTAVPAPPGSDVQGIRIYDVKPLLVVSGAQVSVALVPNTNRAYALQFNSFLAKHEVTAEFANGFLSKLTSNQDTTALAIALVQLVQKAVETGRPIATAFSGTNAPTLNERVQVYEFIFDEAGNLAELKPLLNQRSLLRLPRHGQPLPPAGTGLSGPPARPDGGINVL